MFTICDLTLFQGATAAEIIDGIVANEALSASEPVDVTIGGLGGLQIDTQLDPDWTGPCALTPDDPPAKDLKDLRNRIIVLDRPGGSFPSGSPSARRTRPTSRPSSPRRCRSSRVGSST